MVVIRLFPINSLGFKKCFTNGKNSNHLLGTHIVELLESGLERSGKNSCVIQSPECQELSTTETSSFRYMSDETSEGEQFQGYM